LPTPYDVPQSVLIERLAKKTIAAKIAEQTDSLLIEVRGHTFLLYKRKKKKG